MKSITSGIHKKYMTFCGRLLGMEKALWDWGREKEESRFIHPSMGHEASAFIITQHLSIEKAFWALYYRSHAWLLAFDISLTDIIKTITGHSSGCLKKNAGPMHLFLHPNIIDCNSIVGGQIPIALGVAIANSGKMPTVCIFGDGATNTGVFYESLNIASYYKANILFVVEDNEIAINTPYKQTTNVTIKKKFALFSIPCFSTVVSNIDKDISMAEEAISLISEGPVAICINSPRIGAHALSFQNDWDIFTDRYCLIKEAENVMLSTYNDCTKILDGLPVGVSI